MSLSVGNAALLPGRNLIGSEWREAALGARFAVADPATGKVIAHVPDSGARDAGAAVTAAHQAFADWRRTPAKVRAQIIKRWNALLHENAEDLARLISSEQGKPLAEARGEVSYAASYVEWFAEEATRADGDLIPSPAQGRRMFALR
ncbi:aldehyde dehydrogenase family protein, partial [Bordetella pertussis]